MTAEGRRGQERPSAWPASRLVTNIFRALSEATPGAVQASVKAGAGLDRGLLTSAQSAGTRSPCFL